MTTLDRSLATLLVTSVILLASREAQVLAQSRTQQPDILVSVSGAVARPGVLRLPAEARLVHAVEGCGGLNANADRESVQLAKPLSDGEHVIVAAQSLPPHPPELVETPQVPQQVAPSSRSRLPANRLSEAPSQLRQADRGSEVAPSAPRQRRARSAKAAPAEEVGVLNINSASVEELDRLPGVGPVLAQRIVTAREAAPGATFSSLEELETIRGIKGKTLLRLRPHLKLEGP